MKNSIKQFIHKEGKGFVQINWLSDLKKLNLKTVKRGVYDLSGERVGEIFSINGRRNVGFYAWQDAKEYIPLIEEYNDEELVYHESFYTYKVFDGDGNLVKEEICFG